MKFISLFSGIGGFDLGLEQAGMECALQVDLYEPELVPELVADYENNLRNAITEKEAKKIKDNWRSLINAGRQLRFISEKQWPNIQRINGVQNVKKTNIPTVNLIVGGFPCQGISLAGRRAGLAGKRSGLWFEFYRIIEEVKPEWVVIENVPGLLSSNSGDDMLTILNSLEDSGYIIDCDIIDAQYFGVPQRRRRVFIVCQHIDDILNKKTILSAQTIAQCLIEILGSFLVEAERLSPTGRKDLDFQNSRDGLMRKIKLFGIAKESHLLKWRSVLDEGLAKCQADGKNLEVERLGGLVEDISSMFMGDQSSDTKEKMDIASGLWNTDSLWNGILEEIYLLVKSFTTSTHPKLITESKIFFYARTADIIGRYIILLSDYSPDCWTPVSSALTVIKEYMSYARQASNSLFTEVEWIQPWHNFISEAEHTHNNLERCLRKGRAQEVLFERDSSPWDSAPGREAGAGVAGTTPNGTRGGDIGGVERGKVAISNRNGQTSDVAEPIRADCHGAVPMVAFSESGPGWWRDGIGTLRERDYKDGNSGLICGALPAHSPRHGHAMTTRQAAESGQLIAATLNSGGNDGGFRTEPGEHLVVNFDNGVRRLTPVEAERLQGFPDDFTADQSDSARHRQLGNAVAVPVARWIGERIMRLSYE